MMPLCLLELRDFLFAPSTRNWEAQTFPILIKLGAFFTFTLLRTKGQHKGGEMRQIAPARARFKQFSPLLSVTSQTKAPLSHFLPCPGKLVGWRKPPVEQGLGRAVLGRYHPSQRGLSPTPGLGAQFQAVCFLNKMLTHLQEAL